MNAIQRMKEGILETIPDTAVQMSTPTNPRSPWWLDARFGKSYVVVEWRPGLGFGLSTGEGDGYGDGPDELYEKAEDATRRVVEILRSGESTRPPEQVSLQELRLSRGVTQQEVATAIGITQAALSKLEHRGDASVQTLRSIVQALGGELEVAVRFGERAVKLDLRS